jgi:hypothetical protein
MDAKPLDELVRNIDRRLERVEQFLPTLATKEELRDAVANLATKDELRGAVADLATKAELQGVRAELREEGERTRRHFDIVAEEMKGQTRLIAEALESKRR